MQTRAIKLEHALGGAITLLVVVLAGVLSYTLGRAAVTRVEAEIGGRLATLADQMQDKLDRGLFERYREITNAASLLPLFESSASGEGRERLLDQLRATFGEYAWIGYADSTGKVLSATDGLLVGTDLSKWPSFKAALQAPTVGQVRNAPFPAAAEPGSELALGRVVDIAAPVIDAEGDTTGVLVAYLSWNWAEEIKDSLFGTDEPVNGIDVLIVAPSGVVLLGPPKSVNQVLDLSSVKEALAGHNRALVEVWPDGTRYLTGFAKSEGYRSFPGLGWIVLVRQPAAEALVSATHLQEQVIGVTLAAVLIASFAAWFLADRLAAPLLRLAQAAEQVRRGENVEIPAVAAYSEVSALSVSLKSLVAELQARQANLAQLNQSLESEVRARTSELAAQNAELATAKDVAEQATAAKSRFLAAASHDLRQPLHAMVLFARALSRRVQGEEAVRLVRQMEEALASLRSMFDALLNISRLDAGLVAPDKRAVDVTALLERIATGFRAEAQSRGLDFRTRTRISATVYTDEAILEAMVRNLLANALKFTRKGGILLAARLRGDRVMIEVYDTGPGIAPAEQSAIFQEFRRAKFQALGPNDGLGLGLSIVARYARLLDTTIALRTHPGRGSCFRLIMPRSHAAGDVGFEPDHAPPVETEGRRVLVLDDEPLIVAALSRELADAGYVVVGAETIAQAERAFDGEAPIDLAVVDLDLSGPESGATFLARMEKRLGHAIPGLILSGGTDAQTLATLARSGRPFLIKPADARAITDALARLPTPIRRLPAEAASA